MDTPDFIKQLNHVQELIQNENYKQALSIIEKLKQIESQGDFDYNLTHKLYQLDSNTHSLFNQQKILELITDLSISNDSISFQDLNQLLKERNKIILSDDIIQREIELLILRNLISCKIEGDKLTF
ncbi:MAG: hypothetical protein ACFFC3_13315 [Candidatus Odinarchaeota archaeon]